MEDEPPAQCPTRTATLTWAVCSLFECSFLAAASAHVKHTFIALGWDGGGKKLVSVKMKLLPVTVISNSRTALHIQTSGKNTTNSNVRHTSG